MTIAINLKNISKKFNGKFVLHNLNLQVKAGEIIGLLGPNGAGKSTLIKIMTGLIKPDNGEVIIFDEPLSKNKRSTYKNLSIAPQSLAIYPQLSVKQNLKSFGAINGLSSTEIKQKYDTVTRAFGLQDIENKIANNLSGGQKRRLHSAIALMSHAKIIFLDEPTVGADIDSRNNIIQTVKYLSKQGFTIIYTTHYLQEMESLNARIVFLNNGTIQVSDNLKNIIDRYAHPSLELYFKDEIPEDIAGWQLEDNHLLKSNNLNSDENNVKLLQDILSRPALQDKHLTNIKVIKADLESAYHTLLERNNK